MLWTPSKYEPLVWIAAAPVVALVAIALAVLLSGCATYWYQDPSLSGFEELPNVTATSAQVRAICRSNIPLNGCTRWDLNAGTVQSFLLATADECARTHEAKH